MGGQMERINEVIRENIVAELRARGWTQHDLAEAAGVTDAAVGHWLHRAGGFRVSTLVRIAAALRVELHEFLQEEGADEPD